MCHVIRWSCLAVALAAFGTPFVEAQNKPKPNAKGVSATPQEYQLVLSAGEVTGKIARLDYAQRLITVQVETQVVQGGSGQQGQNALQNVIRQQQQIARQIVQRPNNNQNPAQQARQVQQRMAQAPRQQAQALNRNDAGTKVQTVKKEFEFQADEKVRVRLMTLPQEYDDRGKPKKYSQAELKELKGPNPSLPGYLSEFEDLRAGQTVKLHVAPAKRAAAAKPAKDVDVDKDLPVLDLTKPRATMVLILKDEGGLSPAKEKPRKK